MPEVFRSLALKWRPQQLADIVGQQYVVRALQNAVREDRLHHAFLFTGTRGIGKTTLARILAMLINCEQRSPDGGEPCLTCPTCRDIATGKLVDVIEQDAASHTQVEKMRELLESAAYAPVRAKSKVFIIDEAHMLSKNAFNAMLKTLEEPPPHVKFILATTDPQKLPATIKSRCLCFALLPLSQQQISDRLGFILKTEQRPFEQDAIDTVARLAAGSLRDGLSILEQGLAHCEQTLRAADVRRITGDIDITLIGDTLRAVINQDATAINALTARYEADSIDFDTALARLAALLYKIALTQMLPATTHNNETAETPLITEFQPQLQAEEVQVLYEIALRGRKQLPLSPDANTGFEMTLLRMMLFTPAPSGGHGRGRLTQPHTEPNPHDDEPKRHGGEYKQPLPQPRTELAREHDEEKQSINRAIPVSNKPAPPANGSEQAHHHETDDVDTVRRDNIEAAMRHPFVRTVTEIFPKAELLPGSIRLINKGDHHG